MEIQVVFLETIQYVSKVSSRFEYFFLIFAPRPVLDAEFNSASNHDTFKGSSGTSITVTTVPSVHHYTHPHLQGGSALLTCVIKRVFTTEITVSLTSISSYRIDQNLL
jgi:hypothetical protein